ASKESYKEIMKLLWDKRVDYAKPAVRKYKEAIKLLDNDKFLKTKFAEAKNAQRSADSVDPEMIIPYLVQWRDKHLPRVQNLLKDNLERISKAIEKMDVADTI